MTLMDRYPKERPRAKCTSPTAAIQGSTDSGTFQEVGKCGQQNHYQGGEESHHQGDCNGGVGVDRGHASPADTAVAPRPMAPARERTTAIIGLPPNVTECPTRETLPPCRCEGVVQIPSPHGRGLG